MIARLLAATDATWPAAETVSRGGWLIRRGAGGGKRISSASASPRGAVPDLAPVAAQMAAWDQPVMLRLGDDEAALAEAAGAAGLVPFDPVDFFAAPVAALADGADETARIIRVSTDVHLAAAAEIFESCGIGQARRAVMARPSPPKTVLLARIGDAPVAAAFVAADREVAMIHAISVLPDVRRQGAGRMLMHGAANWAAEAGADTLALAVSKANAPAIALYRALGMEVAARYHYRVPPEIAGGASPPRAARPEPAHDDGV